MEFDSNLEVAQSADAEVAHATVAARADKDVSRRTPSALNSLCRKVGKLIACALPVICVQAEAAPAQKAANSTYFVRSPSSSPKGILIAGSEVDSKILPPDDKCEGCLVELRCKGPLVREDVIFKRTGEGRAEKLGFKVTDIRGKTIFLKCSGDTDYNRQLFVPGYVDPAGLELVPLVPGAPVVGGVGQASGGAEAIQGPIAPLPGSEGVVAPSGVPPAGSIDFPGSEMRFDEIDVNGGVTQGIPAPGMPKQGAARGEKGGTPQRSAGPTEEDVTTPKNSVEPAARGEDSAELAPRKWSLKAGGIYKHEFGDEVLLNPLGFELGFSRKILEDLGLGLDLGWNSVTQSLSGNNPRFRPRNPGQKLNGNAVSAMLDLNLSGHLYEGSAFGVEADGAFKAGPIFISVPGSRDAAVAADGALADVPPLNTMTVLGEICGGVGVMHKRLRLGLGAEICAGAGAIPVQAQAAGDPEFLKEASVGVGVRYEIP